MKQNKRICVSGIGLCSDAIVKAIASLPTVYPFSFDHNKAAKQKKKLLRELARRQRNLDMLNNKPNPT